MSTPIVRQPRHASDLLGSTPGAVLFVGAGTGDPATSLVLQEDINLSYAPTTGILTSEAFAGDGSRLTNLPVIANALIEDADAGTVIVDWARGVKHRTLLTASRTLVFENALIGQAVTIVFESGGTGAFTPVWPAGVRWQGGTSPVLTNLAGHFDLIGLYQIADGVYIGSVALNFF